MESLRKQWNKNQTTFREVLLRFDQHEEAMALFLKQHAALHSAEMVETGDWSFEDELLDDMTEDQMFNGIEKHAKDGIDFMTVHCGVTRQAVDRLKKSGRLTDIVSRGGAFLAAWIVHNEQENPLYANYDYLLELAREYEFTLSLGDGLRPGSISDATDAPQLQELITNIYSAS